MKFIIFIFSLPIILSSPYRDIQINFDDECGSNKSNNLLKKDYAALVTFSSKVSYGTDDCTVHITNPWLTNIQYGFGLFIARQLDCSSMLTVDCLTASSSTNETKPLPVQFTCHTSKNNIEMPCSSISLTLKRNAKMPEGQKPTHVQVVALAKQPCIDDELFFQCSEDYPNSCLDKKLKCNGRSECPSGDDERDCHIPPANGVSLIVFLLIVIAVLILFCLLSTVFICCCFRAAFNGIVRRFRSRKVNKPIRESNVAVNGEDAILMKGLTATATDIEVSSQRQTEPTTLIIDSTKPIYPRLE